MITNRLCSRKGGELQAHHVVRFADNYELRFILSNGVTLCKKCHKYVTGLECFYIGFFNFQNNKLCPN